MRQNARIPKLAILLFAAMPLLLLGDLLVQFPVLDARENMVLAEQIRGGALGAEPFYRALLYPLLLAVLSHLPVALPLLAGVFGIFCHVLSALLTADIGRRLWRSEAAGVLGGLLYALYPVAHFYSVLALDTTLSITLFLAALASALRMPASRHPLRTALWACLWCMLAVQARPHFIAVAAVLPLMCVFVLEPPGALRIRARHLAILSLPLIAGLLGFATLNWLNSGRFSPLPWQGAYNLYAANGPAANGKHFTQVLDLSDLPPGSNPTRAQSIRLFEARNPTADASDIGAMNRYWRAQTLAHIFDHPSDWLGLLARKGTYLLNNFEQYNNFTYGFHKERIAALRYNPLGWGVLLLLATAALLLGARRADRKCLVVLLSVAAAYATLLLLFYASARFRLPLVPVLCALAGGMAILRWQALRQHLNAPRRLLALLVGIGTAAALTFPPWLDANNRQTEIQDSLLLATAAANMGHDAQTVRFSEAVLAQQPENQAALRLNIAARFNQLAFTDQSSADAAASAADWALLRERTTALQAFDAPALLVAGLLEWRDGNAAMAVELWRQSTHAFPYPDNPAWCALDLLGQRPPNAPPSPMAAPALRAALARLLNATEQ